MSTNETENKLIPIISNLLSFFGLGSLAFFVIGIQSIDNYINWLIFSLTLILTGALFGLMLFYIICYFLPDSKTYKNSKGIGFIYLLVFSFMMFFYGLGATVNESSNREVVSKPFVIKKFGDGGYRSKVYYVFINNGDKEERLSFGKKFNDSHKAGDTIYLYVVTGMLGFKYYEIN